MLLLRNLSDIFFKTLTIQNVKGEKKVFVLTANSFWRISSLQCILGFLQVGLEPQIFKTQLQFQYRSRSSSLGQAKRRVLSPNS